MTAQPLDNISDMDTSDVDIDTTNRQFISSRSTHTHSFNPHDTIIQPNITPLTEHQDLTRRYFASCNQRYDSLTPSNSISFASHNVNGLSSSHKQHSLLQALDFRSLDIIGLSDTRLKDRQSQFAFASESDFKAFWSPMANDAHAGGVGFLIRSSYCKFIQKFIRWNGRLIIADLFMKGHIKMRIINAYYPPLDTFNASERALLTNEIINRIKEVPNYYCIVMGDFNTNLDVFNDNINHGRNHTTPYNLFKFLHGRGYVDSHPIYNDATIPTFVRRAQLTQLPLQSSRIDTI